MLSLLTIQSSRNMGGTLIPNNGFYGLCSRPLRSVLRFKKTFLSPQSCIVRSSKSRIMFALKLHLSCSENEGSEGRNQKCVITEIRFPLQAGSCQFKGTRPHLITGSHLPHIICPLWLNTEDTCSVENTATIRPGTYPLPLTAALHDLSFLIGRAKARQNMRDIGGKCQNQEALCRTVI